jgi:hypothetical protein
MPPGLRACREATTLAFILNNKTSRQARRPFRKSNDRIYKNLPKCPYSKSYTGSNLQTIPI